MTMFSVDYVRRVLRALDPEITVLVERAASGVPLAEYDRLVGRIAGLRRARELLLEPLNSDQQQRLPLDPS